MSNLLNNLISQDENLKYILYDFETCGLNLLSLENKPWQIGFLVCQGSKILETHAYYIKWDKLIVSPGAAKATRFDYNHYLKNAVENEKILDLFEKYIYSPEYLILFHNGLQFDTYIHNIWRKNLGRKPDYSFINRCIDSNALSKAEKLGNKYSGDINDDFLAFQYSNLSIKAKGVKTNLTALGKELKITEVNYDNLHDATEDCKLNRLIWEKHLKWRFDLRFKR